MMRFRPRFSVRTLAILVTLVCAYFGAWEATKRFAKNYGELSRIHWPLHPPRYPPLHPQPQDYYVHESYSPLPFIVAQKGQRYQRVWEFRRRYYIWLFGRMFAIPYETEWTPDPNP